MSNIKSFSSEKKTLTIVRAVKVQNIKKVDIKHFFFWSLSSLLLISNYIRKLLTFKTS